jgi:uncharacterized protein
MPPNQPWVGVGLRGPHIEPWLAQRPNVAFVEVHAENYFLPDGGARQWLQAVRQHHPVSLHAVGLGLGSAVGLDTEHLAQLADLCQLIDPVRVSDHACFSRAQVAGPVTGPLTVHGADLLPIAFTQASWHIMARHIEQVQDTLQRPLLIENLSAYLRHADDAWEETDFLNQLCQHTGCQLLVDLNNLVVNALNWSHPHGPAHEREAAAAQEACAWADRIAPQHVGQIHLAGHRPPQPQQLVVDDHSQPINPSVWTVYQHVLPHWGPRPTLVEWDVDLPPLDVLLAQANTAAQYLSCQTPPSTNAKQP